MTTPTNLPLLAIRTQAGPNYKPLTDTQREALQAFCDGLQVGGSYKPEDFSCLIDQGLGADMLYFACAGPKLRAVLATTIINADKKLDPLLENEEGRSILQVAQKRADEEGSYSFDNVIALMQQRVEDNKKQAGTDGGRRFDLLKLKSLIPQRVDVEGNGNAAEAAPAEPAPEVATPAAPAAPTPATVVVAPNVPRSIVKDAKLGAARIREETLAQGPQPLSDRVAAMMASIKSNDGRSF